MNVRAAAILPINELAILSLIAILAGLYLFVRGFRLLARKRLLLNIPLSKIRSASMGLVEISGLAEGPHTMAAPITGRACYLYRATAWQRRESGKNHDWEKVAEETLHVPFFLDDGTGRLLVDPEGAELDLHRDFHEQYDASLFSTRDQAPAEVSNFLARHGVTPSRHIRIEECAIKPKNALFIAGTLAEDSGAAGKSFPHASQASGPNRAGENHDNEDGSAQPSGPKTVPEVVRLSDRTAPIATLEMSQQGKIAAALNKAGIVKPEAWAAAGLSPRAVAESETPQVTEISLTASGGPGNAQEHSEFDLTPSVLLRKGENNSTFLISWRSQRDFVRSLAWKSVAMITGGGALTLLGLYVLLLQMEML